MKQLHLLKKATLLVLFLMAVALKESKADFPPKDSISLASSSKPESKWYDKFSIRGYMQIRNNRLFETNGNLGCEQCDRSWGDNQNFFIRRIRIIFFGQVHKNVYFYIQPDFASSVSTTSLHFGQLRDAYFDVGFDKKNEFRVRIGQSKVPYGFENMQSSQNRLPLDRNDALNSAVSNERDLGVFFYWAPQKTRKLFSELVRDNYKGSGDYGVFAFGAYNGQTANRPELNNNVHVVARVSYPIQIGKQLIEPGIQAYTGKVVVPKTQTSTGVKSSDDYNYVDQRAAASFIMYPKPFGVTAEYNIGRGPEFNSATNTIETQNLDGGYVMLNYRTKYKGMYIFPFTRAQYYNGGKKHELDARSYNIKELELGVEWQFNQHFELVTMYTFSDRKYEDFLTKGNHQKGSLLRLQAQVNF